LLGVSYQKAKSIFEGNIVADILLGFLATLIKNQLMICFRGPFTPSTTRSGYPSACVLREAPDNKRMLHSIPSASLLARGLV
jgi:hypothetical protein